jgi:hypothetical protein
MSSKHHIVVSAENNCYMAWQCKLFHYSCLNYLGLRPVFVVHALDQEWHPYFRDIVSAGGIVRAAPNYRVTANGHDYSPRNTPGTLMQAGRMGYPPNDLIVLCDADMIFLRDITFPRTFASEGCSNLNYEQKAVRVAASKFGIEPALLRRRKRSLECAVPHVVPVHYAAVLSKIWLEAIDCFDPGVWQTSMYAFGFAVIRLKLRLALTRLVALNDEPLEKIGRAKIIHYSYGDKSWNKRDYWHNGNLPRVWRPSAQAPRGTVLGEIISQIRAAAVFYGNGSRQLPK